MKRLSKQSVRKLINNRIVGGGAVILVTGIVIAAVIAANHHISIGPLPNLDSNTSQSLTPTNNFKVSANWGIKWSYDCSNVSPQPGVFGIIVQTSNGSDAEGDGVNGISTNGVKGSGVQQESQGGVYQLYINSDPECNWRVQVVNNSSPTTISDAPAPKQSSQSNQPAQPQNNSPAKYEVYPQGGSPTTDATTWISDGAATVINPADLRLYGEVKDIGGTSGTPQCTIQANDPSYSYHGTDIVTRTSPLNPSGVWDWHDDLTITSQGASYITQISVSCRNS